MPKHLTNQIKKEVVVMSMYQGACLCGAVQFEIRGGIDSVIHCHCSLCRKSSGTAYATNGFVDTDKFKLIQGEDNLSSFGLKPGQNRHFCKTCGSPIYSSNSEDPARIRVRLGTITSDISERPGSHNFVGSKANWDTFDSTLVHYEELEPSRVQNK
ncbi:MAG: hypothetical protein ACI9FJ_000583 [Alteromonadaceae bacterium]|jgi:hypothetical protein